MIRRKVAERAMDTQRTDQPRLASALDLGRLWPSLGVYFFDSIDHSAIVSLAVLLFGVGDAGSSTRVRHFLASKLRCERCETAPDGTGIKYCDAAIECNAELKFYLINGIRQFVKWAGLPECRRMLRCQHKWRTIVSGEGAPSLMDLGLHDDLFSMVELRRAWLSAPVAYDIFEDNRKFCYQLASLVEMDFVLVGWATQSVICMMWADSLSTNGVFESRFRVCGQGLEVAVPYEADVDLIFLTVKQQ